MNWSEHRVFVTGGTGSFGQRLVTHLRTSDAPPEQITVYSRDEAKQHEMRTRGLDHPSIRYVIGDVRDRERLTRAAGGATLVVHTAALKQVPACEANPDEAIDTNILGARNVIHAVLHHRVPRAIACSTDKAVHPVNLYGATKLVAEKLFVQADVESGPDGPRFACCRYGNVVGSRGSVVPTFLARRATGTVPITDPRMTRFWMTQTRAVEFVTATATRMRGGEIFVPKIPSMRITDLATALAPDCEQKVIGLRPGEKIHEALIAREEAARTLDCGDHFEIRAHRDGGLESTARILLGEDFAYTSDQNDSWLSIDALRDLLAGDLLAGDLLAGDLPAGDLPAGDLPG